MNNTIDFKTYKLIVTLRNLVNYHSRLYYNENRTELSDADFDRLYQKLEQLELNNPWCLDHTSPTQKVGGTLSYKFKKIKHLFPMYSLDKVHSEKEFEAWDLKIQKLKQNF